MSYRYINTAIDDKIAKHFRNTIKNDSTLKTAIQTAILEFIEKYRSTN